MKNPFTVRIDPTIAIPKFFVGFVNPEIGNDSTGTIVRDIETQTIFAPPPVQGGVYFATVDGAYNKLQDPSIPIDKRVIFIVVTEKTENLEDITLTSGIIYKNIIFTGASTGSGDFNPKTLLSLVVQTGEGSVFQTENCAFQSIVLIGNKRFFLTKVTLNIKNTKMINVVSFGVTINKKSNQQSDDITQLEVESEGTLFLEDVSFILQTDPTDDHFVCLNATGDISGAFPNLDSKASKDVIIIQADSDTSINFDGSIVDNNNIDITSLGPVVMVEVDNPVENETEVIIDAFTFNIDTLRSSDTALFMTTGDTVQIDQLFDIENCNFNSDNKLTFNNTSSLTSLFNFLNNIDFIYNQDEAMTVLDPSVINFIPDEEPINYSMTDLSFHSSVSQFYIAGTINKSIELEVNDKFIYYIDASNERITIVLPSGNLDIEGKMVIFKVISKSKNRITLTVKEGLIENRRTLTFPKISKNNNCNYPAVTVHFREGNWWILNSYNF